MKKQIAALLSVVLVFSSVTGCSNKKVSIGTGSPDIEFSNNTSNSSKDETKVSIKGKVDTTSFAGLMDKWDAKVGAGNTIGDYGISPIYNVEDNAKFTFHFNSKVDPFQAVTVHTDRNCDVNSMVATQNQSYFTENGGIDVIVTNWLSPVLDSNDRLDHIENNDSWGHAGKYYLSVNYDMDASVPTKLERPIVIPFTLMSDVKVPQTTYKITSDGGFKLVWTDCEADRYRIYVGTKAHNRRPGTFEREYGYIGLHLECIDEVDGNSLEYVLKDSVTPMSNSTYSKEYYSTQNLIEDGVYFVTAVKDGKESDFGLEVSVYNYLSQLPYCVENGYFDRFNLDLAGARLPEQINVIMKDNSVATYPVNYTLVGKSGYTNIDNTADYYYEIPGTKLTGFVSINIGDKERPEEKITSMYQMNAGLYETRLDLSKVSDSDFPIILGVDNKDVDLTKIKDYNPNARVVYNQEALAKRLDLETARIVSDGEYTSDPNAIYVVDYNDRQNDLEERKKQLGDIFSNTNSGSEQVVESEGTTEVNKETEGSGSSLWDFDETEESTESSVEESTEVLTEESEGEPAEEDTIDTEITADNIIEKKIEEDNRNLEEGQEIVFDVPAKYPVFADSMEEEYLALSLMAQEEAIRVDILPNLLDIEYLGDAVLKVKHQNPYILGINSMDLYLSEDETELYLVPGYEYSKEEAVQKQAEVYDKTLKVANEIYTPSMTDEEKIEATWDYLEKNARYDYECCDYLEAHNFQVQGEYPYKDSSSVYGILCKGIGVCASYSYAMVALLNAADVDCISVVGYVDKTMPHAWNAVKLDGKWYQIDATNNYTTMGLPYYMYNVSSDYATSLNYVPDERWALDSELNMLVNTDNTKEWYSQNGLIASDENELTDMLVKGWVDSEYTGYGVMVDYDIQSVDPSLSGIGEKFVKKMVTDKVAEVSEIQNMGAALVDNHLLVIKDMEAYEKEHSR